MCSSKAYQKNRSNSTFFKILNKYSTSIIKTPSSSKISLALIINWLGFSR